MMSKISFFKQRKMRVQDVTEICSSLQYEYKPKSSVVIRKDEEGDLFYIILRGRVSVWVPIINAEMKKPINYFKDQLKKLKAGQELTNCEFRFPVSIAKIMFKKKALAAEIEKEEIVGNSETEQPG